MALRSPRRPLLILNPIAGGGRARRVEPLLRAALREHAPDGQVVLTERPGHAEEIARQAGRHGFDRVVGVGGDGTLHEIANGLLRALEPPALGVIPVGAGNDFARSLGLPADPRAALQVALDGVEEVIDVGRCRERYFLNAGGVGFDARVAQAARSMPAALRVGALPYVAGVLVAVARNANEVLVVHLDGRRIERRSLLVAVANGPFYGGGMQICPSASRSDGQLDVCVVGDMPRREVLRLLPKVFSGGHVGHPLVEFHRSARVRVEGPPDGCVQVDGEIVGTLPAEFEVVPAALRVRRPRSAGS